MLIPIHMSVNRCECNPRYNPLMIDPMIDDTDTIVGSLCIIDGLTSLTRCNPYVLHKSTTCCFERIIYIKITQKCHLTTVSQSPQTLNSLRWCVVWGLGPKIGCKKFITIPFFNGFIFMIFNENTGTVEQNQIEVLIHFT